MEVIVTLLGVLIVGVSLALVVRPLAILGWIGGIPSEVRFWSAIGLRLVLGGVVIAVAPECRAPRIVQAVGAVAIAAAFGLLLLGRQRLDQLVDWWQAQSPGAVRAWSGIALALGAFLVYAGG